jgi:acyl-CoA synthetase (NDP forming)
VMLESVKIFSKERIGVNKLISMGNKLDLKESDYLEYLISDGETKTIVLYLENIADGRRLMDLAGRCDKPIIALKANRNPSSHEIARFHTSALAGDDLVADSALRQAGIHRVETLQEMVDCVRIFGLPIPRGRKLAVLGRSGGLAVILADAVHRYGFELARLSEDFFNMVGRETRAGVIRMTNPLDMGDIFNIDFYVQLMEKALQEKDVDGLVISHSYVVDSELETSRKIIQEAERLCGAYGKPVVFCLVTDRKNRFLMNPTGDFPVFEDVDHAMRALARSYGHHRTQSLRARGKGFKGVGPLRRKGKKIEIANAGDIFSNLARHGLPVVGHALAGSVKEALVRARKMGYPVALKTASLDILHKTEAGGVRIGIKGPGDLANGFRAMVRDLKKNGYRPEELLIQKMVPKGQEVFIGGKQDPEFGPVILFGLGGVFVEVLKDIAIRVAPIDAGTAREMIEEIKGSAILKGFRGQLPSDLAVLIQCMVRASRLLAEHPEIKNLDINPLVVLEKGKGCLIVDAKMDVI